MSASLGSGVWAVGDALRNGTALTPEGSQSKHGDGSEKQIGGGRHGWFLSHSLAVFKKILNK